MGSDASNSVLSTQSSVLLEIERKFLLDRLPEIPRGAEIWRIEQGYLSPVAPNETARGFESGRLRRITAADGAVSCWHSVKTGAGLVRTEFERQISPAEFEQHWPRTATRRLLKTRYRVPDRGLTWEIDDFEQINLRLAEVELPSPDAAWDFPAWLKAHVVRDVTDDASFTNANIAFIVGALFR